MQKKLIALAIAGLAAGSAFAQSNVTVYGRVDYGFVSRGDGSGAVADPGNKSEFASGVQSGSRIGFKGAEDLGNGWKALFETEFQVNLDSANATATTATNQFWNRHSYIGLTSGTYGTFVGGRVDGARYGFATKYDAFGAGTVGTMSAIQTHQTRADNAIAYISPSFGGGFSVLAAYSHNLTGQEHTGTAAKKAVASDITTTPITLGSKAVAATSGNEGDISLWALAPMYDNGPISAVYDHEEAEMDGTDGKIKINVLAGSYDFGSVKVSAYWEKVKSEGALATILPWDQKSYYLAAAIPVMTNGKVKVNWGKNEDRAAGTIGLGDCKKFSLGFDYALSKRTNVYTDYSKISNEGAGTCAMGFAGTTHSLDVGGTGYGVRGLDVGIAHTF